MSEDRKDTLSVSLIIGLQPLVGLFYCGGAVYVVLALYTFAAVADQGLHARLDLGEVLIGHIFWGTACFGMVRAVSCIIVVYEESKRIREGDSGPKTPAKT